jgi:hypothetical protein
MAKKEEQKPSAKEEVRKSVKGFGRFLGWLIPIAVLVVAVVFIIRGNPEPEFTGKPDSAMNAYMEFILPFLGNSGQKPISQEYDRLMEFFSREARDWAKKNQEFLAWMGMGRDMTQYRQAEELARKQAIFKFIIRQGPTQSVTVQNTKFGEDGDTCTVAASSVRQTYQVRMVKEGGRWRIVGLVEPGETADSEKIFLLWGIPDRFATELAQFQQQAQ